MPVGQSSFVYERRLNVHHNPTQALPLIRSIVSFECKAILEGAYRHFKITGLDNWFIVAADK